MERGVTNTHSAEIHKTLEMVHHILCAFVGPAEDFKSASGEDVCPKCNRTLKPGAIDWEKMTVALLEGKT